MRRVPARPAARSRRRRRRRLERGEGLAIRIPVELSAQRYGELLGELVARVPVHTPEWTEGRRSDPGVTLVELFAFLAENLLYRGSDPRLRKVLRPRPDASIRLVAVEHDRAVLRLCHRRWRLLRRCDEIELLRRQPAG